MKLKALIAAVGAAAASLPGAAWAQGVGRSEPWQMGLQPAYSPVMETVHEFHNFLLIIQVVIVIFVLALMGYIIVRFNRKANPVPSKTTHHTLLEVIWTAVPVLILVWIAVPSLQSLYQSGVTPQDAKMTLKVTGHQWYWSYAYPDHGDFEFDSYIVDKDDLKEGQPRLLTVDNPVVLPVGTVVRVLLNSDDVIHNWAIPSLGLKLDTTPGRTNETWVQITQPGDYYGMCSELCGVNHGFMPIHVKALSEEDFVKWTELAKDDIEKATQMLSELDTGDKGPLKLAANRPTTQTQQ